MSLMCTVERGNTCDTRMLNAREATDAANTDKYNLRSAELSTSTYTIRGKDNMVIVTL